MSKAKHLLDEIIWLLDNEQELWALSKNRECLTYIKNDTYIVLLNTTIENDKSVSIFMTNEMMVIPELLFEDEYKLLSSYFSPYEENEENNVIDLMEMLHGNAI